MEYIPSFIRRKHGTEAISYDVPGMEEFLKETYGITVYQEQVMQLSQKLAGFTKGEADMLRKAMGKKIKAVLDQMKPKFTAGGAERGHPEAVLEKIWKDWEAFALYAFNKSHSTCYAWIAYQTAYLKANYPAEYMAAVLSANEAGDVLHWARTVEGVHGNQITKNRGLEVLEVLLHPKGFVLKNTHRVAPLKELVGCHVVEGNGLNVNFDSVALAHKLHAILNQGKGFEPQEVHLEQACRLYRRVVKLGGPHRAFFGRGHRYELANVAWRDNDSAGMDAQIPQRSF